MLTDAAASDYMNDIDNNLFSIDIQSLSSLVLL